MRRERHFTELRKWSLTCIGVVCASLAAVSPARADLCAPGHNEIALYTEVQFKGSCVVKGIGEHRSITLPREAKQGKPAPDRSAKVPGFASLKLGAGVDALACSKTGFGGTCILVSRDLSGFALHGFASVTSVVVRDADRPLVCAPEANKAAVWEYPYFFGDCQVFNPGAYPYSIEPLEAGSLEVGAEARAKLCTGAAFESPCREFRPGSYESWSYEGGGRRVRGIEVRPDSVSLACQPGDFQVSLYEFANYVGRCRRFSNSDQARKEFTPEETWGWAGHKLHSLWVGDEVHARLCWENEQGRNECFTAFSERAEGLPEFDLDHPPSLTVFLDDPPEEEEPRDEEPEGEEEISDTVWLSGSVAFEGGFPWWQARFPGIGNSDGTLTRVANPRNSVWLGFLRPGSGSEDCGDSDAYVLLRPGDTMTDDQMEEAFGAENPELPITFVACSGADADVGPRGELRWPALPLNISYVVPR